MQCSIKATVAFGAERRADRTQPVSVGQTQCGIMETSVGPPPSARSSVRLPAAASRCHPAVRLGIRDKKTHVQINHHMCSRALFHMAPSTRVYYIKLA